MASVIYITCRTLASSCSSGYRHIASVGWEQDGGQSGNSTRAEVVAWLEESGGNQAYTRAQGREARVNVHRCGCGTKYIESQADSTKVDNLRELPTC